MNGVVTPVTEEIRPVSDDDTLADLIRNLTPHVAQELWEIRVCLKPQLADL